MAERLVWEFEENLPKDQKFGVSVINPGFIVGPILGKW